MRIIAAQPVRFGQTPSKLSQPCKDFIGPLMARNHRAAVLSNGLCRDDDLDAVIDNAVTFIAAGIRALAISHAVDEAGRLRSGNSSTPA